MSRTEKNGFQAAKNFTIKMAAGVVLATSVMSGMSAHAQTESADGPYVDVMPFLTRVDKDRLTERQAGGLRAAYGWGWGGNWYSEVQAFGTELDNDNLYNTGNVQLSGLGFDMVYSFSGRRGYSPYVLFGAGASHNNVKYNVSDETNAFLNAAAGITTQGIGSRGIKLRAEIRFLHDYFENDMNDWQFGLGISIPLRCPPTPVAPAPMPVAAPVVVDLPDSDGDGVLDRDDRCPDTLPGTTVDDKGCVIANQTITLENIQFEFNSAKLTPSAQSALNLVVQSLRSQPGSLVEIAGHTDSKGNDAYNLKLSRQRANSVRAYMIRNGIDAARIQAQGYGEQQPVAPNDTDAGRAKNRRVEMRFR